MEWDALSPDCWAQRLGMARASQFGRSGSAPAGLHNVFLDGRAASFALSIANNKELVFGPDPVSWAWSSYLRNSLVLTSTNSHLFFRTWDNPHEPEALRVPRTAADADTLVRDLAKKRQPKAADVVGRMILAFKKLRSVLSAYGADNLDVIRAFNLLIECAEERGTSELAAYVTIEDVLLDTDISQGHDALQQYKHVHVDEAAYIIANAAPRSLSLNAPLFIRHASGDLYQEAHFELERQAYLQTSLFGGIAPNETRRGTHQRDARFTPPELARTLIEQSVSQFSLGSIADLDILDPASGSGVFLQEALRELEGKYFGNVKAVGIDSSAISVEIANFRLKRAVEDARDAGLQAAYEIGKPRNALLEDWASPSLILMNPPFASYRDMVNSDRMACRDILKELAVGHFDKSMAFIWKAVCSVKAGGVVASVLPSSLLDGDSGRKWRAAILDQTDLCSVGRFKGYSYFQGAMVEPAFIILKKKGKSGETPQSHPVVILVAEENSEDAAMRALRKGYVDAEDVDSVFLTSEIGPPNPAAGWMPRNYKYRDLLDALSGIPAVGELFDVRLGVIAGSNRAFVLPAAELAKLPQEERAFFHPAAGTQTIRQCQLHEEEFVFYPYDANGLQIGDEATLIKSVPEYYKRWLEPASQSLKDRPAKRGAPEQWWALTEHRAWQRKFEPKIVTAYFGSSGKFAYDQSGRFVALHGYAWFWRAETNEVKIEIDGEEGESDEDSVKVWFWDTTAPFAFIAVLNSRPFSILLSCFCPRVQGGQFNLSKRFIKNVPLPDLLNGQIPGDIVDDLAEVGQQLTQGVKVDERELSALVARAYGVGLTAWGLDGQS